MKCHSLFSEKNKKNIMNMSSAEFAQSVVTVDTSHQRRHRLTGFVVQCFIN